MNRHKPNVDRLVKVFNFFKREGTATKTNITSMMSMDSTEVQRILEVLLYLGLLRKEIGLKGSRIYVLNEVNVK